MSYVSTDIKKIIAEIIENKKEKGGVKNIYFVGCGGSLGALYPAKTFMEREAQVLRSAWINSNEFVHSTPKDFGENSIICLACHKGNTPETIQAAKLGKEKGAAVIILTWLEESEIIEFGDYIIRYTFDASLDHLAGDIDYAGEKTQCALLVAVELLAQTEGYEKTYKFLTGSSYLTAKLTGKYVIDQFLAKGSFRPLYNRDGTINKENCSLYCRPDQIAECAYSFEIAGTVTEEAAKESGLKKGTPVIVGTGDSTAEAISVGLVESGTVFFQYGSSMFYYYCVDRYVDDYVSANGNGSLKGGKEFTIPGIFCIGDGTNAAGTLTRWVRDTFYEEELKKERAGGENAYAVMAREAAEVEAGSEGLIILPYIYGERSPIQDAKASGMLFGLKGTHTRKQINRAALEAVGYSTLQHMILFDEMNLPPKSVITAGGGTKNAAWMQIICDMIGRQICIPKRYQCSAYGDAAMAALGDRRFRDFTELRDSLPKGKILVPNEKNHIYYKEHYKMFRDLYLNNKDMMHRI